MDIKDYIVDGEYIRGNAEHPEKVQAWLIGKGADEETFSQLNFSDKVMLFFVEKHCMAANWIYYTDDKNCTVFGKMLVEHGTEAELSIDRFDPATLQPFDQVLVRDGDRGFWRAMIFSHIYSGMDDYKHLCTDNTCWRCCIPYNEETKHLLGTSQSAPEYYRYWED